MKANVVAAAAALLAPAASAHKVHHRHAHQDLFERGLNDTGICVPGCTTIYYTTTGEAQLYTPPPAASSSALPTTASSAPSAASPTATVQSSAVSPVPTPVAQTCPTPGTYTFPATTVTLSETTTALAISTTALPSGTHTIGGVTTVVDTSTIVTCPYATVSTNSGVVTSVVEITTYTCPAAGTYTVVPPTTTTLDQSSTITVPVVSTYTPGVYTQPEIVTTVVETSTVIYCPFAASDSTSTTTSTTTSTSTTTVVPTTTATVVPTSSAVAVPATSSAETPAVSVSVAVSIPVSSAVSSPAPSSVVVASSSSVAVASSSSVASSSASSTPTSGSTSGIGGSNGIWSITYTPYTDSSGSCKTQAEITTDVQAIKAAGYKSLRVYSTDCNTLEYVGSACQDAGLEMILGVYIKSSSDCVTTGGDVVTQVEAIAAWANWDIVELIAIGNEAINNGFCTISTLATVISYAKSAFQAAGYTGPITTTDTVNIYQDSGISTICDLIDVSGCNSYAFFNGAIEAADAGTFVQSEIEIVEKACGKDVYVLESGWPYQGPCNGVACPSTENQAAAIAAIRSTVGNVTVDFTYGTAPQLWKTGEWESYFVLTSFESS